MGSKTLLQLINTTQAELGLVQSSTVVGNSDATTIQMLALLNLVLDDIRDEKQQGWTCLQKEYDLDIWVPNVITGDLQAGSNQITAVTSVSGTLSDLTTWGPQFWVALGEGLPSTGGGCRVSAFNGSTTISLNMLAIATATGVTITLARDTYLLPDDFDRYIGNTWWDRTNYWALFGPDSPQLDQLHRSGVFTTGPRRHFRQIGPVPKNDAITPYASAYRIWPAPTEITVPLQLSFEYISNSPVITGFDGLQAEYAQYFGSADTETCIFDDRVLVMGLKWRFFAQKGLNWVPLRTDYKRYLDKMKARDGGNSIKSLVRTPTPYLIDSSQIQDGFFPGPGLAGYSEN